MKAYSVDLRQKVVDAYEQQEGSQRELAKRFKVSPNFVRLLLKPTLRTLNWHKQN